MKIITAKPTKDFVVNRNNVNAFQNDPLHQTVPQDHRVNTR